MRKSKQAHIDRIDTLFAQAVTMVPPAALDAEWLAQLKTDAYRSTKGWRPQFVALLQGLKSGQFLTVAQYEELIISLDKCAESDTPFLELFAIGMGAICVAGWTCFTVELGYSWWFLVIASICTAAAGAAWTYQRLSRPRLGAPKSHYRFNVVVIVLFAALAPVVAWLLAGAVTKSSTFFSVENFKRDRAHFLVDRNGYPMIREFARRNFDVDVMLGAVGDSWAKTALIYPGGGSPASMELGPGYCQLNMYSENVTQTFGPKGADDRTIWLRGVMMHEFAHCLDLGRDYPQPGSRTVRKNSIAPIDTAKVTDLQSYIDVSENASTKLWREALADIFAVGYWRLTSPQEAAAMTATLWRKRLDSAKKDTIHATMCWIDHAWKAKGPPSEKDLLQWADRLRVNAGCKGT
jgi:hypothetical protein